MRKEGCVPTWPIHSPGVGVCPLPGRCLVFAFAMGLQDYGCPAVSTDSISPPVSFSGLLCLLTWHYCCPQVKCDHYWPFTEEPIAYGDITVEMVSEEEEEDWASRHFRINYVSFQQIQRGWAPSLQPTNSPNTRARRANHPCVRLCALQALPGCYLQETKTKI